MKIAHVVDTMEMGGAEMLVSQLCHVQRGQGHSPSVHSLAGPGVVGHALEQHGFVVESNMGRRMSDSMRNFLRLFRELRPDVVHLHNARPTIYAAMPARVAGVSSIVSTRHGLVLPPHRWPRELKYACAAGFCDWVAAVCDGTACNLRSLRTISARKIVRVYNGATPLARSPRERWPAKSGFTLLYAGRLEPVKNHPLLLTAFRTALSSMPGLRLWMVGDGSQRSQLERLARELKIVERVTFWGRQLDVSPFFSAADSFIMSSQSEGLPISLLQAFSLGVPAIVTGVGGMAEAMRIAQAGIPVPATDPTAMAAAILRMAGSPAEREVFARNAAEAFRAHFTAEAMASAYMDLYTRSRAKTLVSSSGGTTSSCA